MPSRADLRRRIADLERELEGGLAGARERWRYRIDKGRVRFERDARTAHRLLMQSIPRFIRESGPANLLTAPMIYSLVVPVVILDLWITVDQRLCFPVYGIARLRQSGYIVIDRHHFAYLNGIEKLNCLYCSYANGVLRVRARDRRTH